MKSTIQFGVAVREDELRQILELQKSNHSEGIGEEQKFSEGFVTVQHNMELLIKMNSIAPQIIAKEGDKVVGYGLVIRPELKFVVPILIPMFDLIETLYYKGKLLNSCRYYVMGQICVAQGHHSNGIFEGLCKKHRDVYSPEYDLCLTEVATRNRRSMKAHNRIGFKTIHTFRNSSEEWNIVLWDWKNA
jgi:hypothetical protein